MKMKFIDGLSLPESNLCSVQSTLTALFGALHTVPSGAIHVTDANGHHVERVKLFEETLSDGSKAYTIELHFSN